MRPVDRGSRRVESLQHNISNGIRSLNMVHHLALYGMDLHLQVQAIFLCHRQLPNLKSPHGACTATCLHTVIYGSADHLQAPKADGRRHFGLVNSAAVAIYILAHIGNCLPLLWLPVVLVRFAHQLLLQQARWP
jgi:hypothetical protein